MFRSTNDKSLYMGELTVGKQMTAGMYQERDGIRRNTGRRRRCRHRGQLHDHRTLHRKMCHGCFQCIPTLLVIFTELQFGGVKTEVLRLIGEIFAIRTRTVVGHLPSGVFACPYTDDDESGDDGCFDLRRAWGARRGWSRPEPTTRQFLG
jgi:NAD-dependent dihydropyrimidine dehydrogenase PreA subunit